MSPTNNRNGALLQCETLLCVLYALPINRIDELKQKIGIGPLVYLTATKNYIDDCALLHKTPIPGDYEERLLKLQRFDEHDEDFEDEIETIQPAFFMVPDTVLEKPYWRAQVEVAEIAAAKVAKLEIITINESFRNRYSRIYRHISLVS